MSPEVRAKARAFEAFSSRAPHWTEANPNIQIKRNGTQLTHLCDRSRDGAIGLPIISAGSRQGVFRFAFGVLGSGIGVVVGVCDADGAKAGDRSKAGSDKAGESAGGEKFSPREGGAWGLNLSHGALYTKSKGSVKGGLGSQQLVPPLLQQERDKRRKKAARTGGPPPPPVSEMPGGGANGEPLGRFIVEVEVDMRRRQIAFGLNDGPLVQAAGTITADSVRSLHPLCTLLLPSSPSSPVLSLLSLSTRCGRGPSFGTAPTRSS